MSEVLDVVKAISDPCVKLIEAVRAGIGKAYEPRHVKKMAEAKAHEIMVIGQAMRENMDVPINYDKGALAMDTGDFDAFVKRTEKRMAYQEMTKQKNIEAVVDEAYAILEDEDDPASEEPVDNDWILRFFNCVQDVSSEDMQRLWAKVLAGEVKRPKSFSMRTLETLHNLSKEEASVFKDLCKYLIRVDDTIFIPRLHGFLENNGIQFSSIMLMEECGLMNGNMNLAYVKPITAQGTGITVMDNVIMVASPKNGNEGEIKFGEYPLTVAGKELWNVVGESANRNVFLSYAMVMKNKNASLNVSAYAVTSSEGNTYHYDTHDLLSKDS